MADEIYEGEIVDNPFDSSPNLPAMSNSMPMPVMQGAGMLQTKTPYVQAMQVIRPRNMEQVEKRVLREAALMGEKSMYGWGAGKGRVEGGSIKLAMSILGAYGNMTVVAESVQETSEAWIFTHYVVDLEAGASSPRQWRESKRSKVDGNMDAERKDQIRFNRGQSKNMRNAILNATPYWLVQKAIEEAKKGSRDKLKKFIDSKGIAEAQRLVVANLKHYGVTEEQILAKMGKAELKGLDMEDIINLNADYRAIESGEEHASSLFEKIGGESTPGNDLKSKLKSRIEATKVDTEAAQVEGLQVTLGLKPHLYNVSDGVKVHEVYLQGDDMRCNCGAKQMPCLHILAAQRRELS